MSKMMSESSVIRADPDVLPALALSRPAPACQALGHTVQAGGLGNKVLVIFLPTSAAAAALFLLLTSWFTSPQPHLSQLLQSTTPSTN